MMYVNDKGLVVGNAIVENSSGLIIIHFNGYVSPDEARRLLDQHNLHALDFTKFLIEHGKYSNNKQGIDLAMLLCFVLYQDAITTKQSFWDKCRSFFKRAKT